MNTSRDDARPPLWLPVGIGVAAVGVLTVLGNYMGLFGGFRHPLLLVGVLMTFGGGATAFVGVVLALRRKR